MSSSRAIIIAAVSLIASGLLATITYWMGYAAGEARGREDQRVRVEWNGSRAQSQDSIRRWLRKTGPREMENRFPYLVIFPDRNCIQLKFKEPSAGGVPIYCYRPNSLKLIEEHSDVE